MVEDCGGIATFHEAVRLAAHSRGRQVCGVSVSESNLHLHAWLHSLFAVVDSDAQHQTWRRFNFSKFLVDFYAAGWPCQPFSRMGDRGGVSDARFAFVIDQLHAILGPGGLQPKCALFENTEDFESVFEKKLAPIARQYDYQYVTIVLNSNIWVPQNRARLYALLIATPFIPRGFDLASLIPTAPVVCPMQSFRSWIRSVSLRWLTIADVRSQHRTGTVFARNLQYVLTTGPEKVKRSPTRPVFVFCDMHTSGSRVSCSLDQIPCVTRTRGEQGRVWVFEAPHQTFVRCAQLDCKVLGSLQGWSSTGITTMLGSISNRQLCAAFGNGMTLPVLVEFVSRVMTMFATRR